MAVYSRNEDGELILVRADSQVVPASETEQEPEPIAEKGKKTSAPKPLAE
jgi:hypothetical protein